MTSIIAALIWYATPPECLIQLKSHEVIEYNKKMADEIIKKLGPNQFIFCGENGVVDSSIMGVER